VLLFACVYVCTHRALFDVTSRTLFGRALHAQGKVVKNINGLVDTLFNNPDLGKPPPGEGVRKEAWTVRITHQLILARCNHTRRFEWRRLPQELPIVEDLSLSGEPSTDVPGGTAMLKSELESAKEVDAVFLCFYVFKFLLSAFSFPFRCMCISMMCLVCLSRLSI
jgi:hypothetical protein